MRLKNQLKWQIFKTIHNALCDLQNRKARHLFRVPSTPGTGEIDGVTGQQHG